jgi:hypothetical protein
MYMVDPQSVPPLLLASSRLPDSNATSYKSMKAYGMHLRCKGTKVHMSTSDSGVAASFERILRLSGDDRNPIVRREEYLGWIEEILELNYMEHCIVVLTCNWVKAKYFGPNPTIIWERYGFMSVNISETTVQGLGPECFAFPIHVQQVHYCRDSRRQQRQTAMKVEVRGYRGDRQYALEEDSALFIVGHDFEFAGLSPDREADRSHHQTNSEGVHVVLQDILPVADTMEVGSNNNLLGDSSEEDV